MKQILIGFLLAFVSTITYAEREAFISLLDPALQDIQKKQKNQV